MLRSMSRSSIRLEQKIEIQSHLGGLVSETATNLEIANRKPENILELNSN